MVRRRRPALTAGLAAGLVVAASGITAQSEAAALQAEYDLRVLAVDAYRYTTRPEASNAKLDALIERAVALVDAEGAQPSSFGSALEWLNLAIAANRERGQPTKEPARRLLLVWRRHREIWPDHRMALPMARQWCETAVWAQDAQALARAVAAGLAAETSGDDLERALIRVHETRLQCRLGRMDKAIESVDRARSAADRYLASVRAEPTLRPQAEQCRLAVALAETDVHLLTGDFDFAGEALSNAPKGIETAVYRDLIAVARGDRTRERSLQEFASNDSGSTRLRTLAMGKLAQAALLRGDLESADRTITGLLELVPASSGDYEGRSASLALELAGRRGAIDGDLLEEARVAYAALLRDWRRAPRLPGGLGFLQLADRSTLMSGLIRAEIAATGDGEVALRRLLEAHAAAARLPSPSPTKARELLTGPEHLALIFVPGRYSSCLVCVDGERTTVHPLESAPRLRAAVDRVHGHISRALDAGDSPEFLASIESMGAALFPKAVVERIGRFERWTISGAGLLLDAPIELIRWKGEERRLGCTRAIDHVPNLVAALDAAPARPIDGPTIVAAALLRPTEGTGYRVPETVKELMKPYTRSRVLADGEVQVRSTVEALEGASVAHLIGHGVNDWSRDYQHGVAFSEGEVLWAEDLRGIRLDGATIVVGACRAATGPWRHGDDPLAASLIGALAEQGARCVIAPSTDVALGRHIELFRRFHADRAKGLAPAEALRRSRASFSAGSTAELEALLTRAHGIGF